MVRNEKKPHLIERRDGDDPVPLTSSPVQHRVLDATREVVATRGAAALLSSTGPLAELTNAQRKGVLNEVRRLLIAKKGAGVVFEARTVAQLQEANERFQLDLCARLSASPNAPLADVTVEVAQREILLQLKTGSDRYIRAAVRGRKDGTVLFIPRDAPRLERTDDVLSTLSFDDVDIQAATRDELVRHSETALDRLGDGLHAVTGSDLATTAIRGAIADGVVAAILDLTLQHLRAPNQPIKWRQTAEAVFRTSATSAASSFLAGACAGVSGAVVGRTIDAAAIFRATRVASCILPHALDLALNLSRAGNQPLTQDELARRLAGHAGAAAAEFIAFPYVARLAAKAGPLGIVVTMIGGALLSRVGGHLGEAAYDFFGAVLTRPTPTSRATVTAGTRAEQPRDVRVGGSPFWLAIGNLVQELHKETDRRTERARKRLCEERNCNRPHHARGWCSKHYQRWWRRQRRLDVRGQSNLRKPRSRSPAKDFTRPGQNTLSHKHARRN